MTKCRLLPVDFICSPILHSCQLIVLGFCRTPCLDLKAQRLTRKRVKCWLCHEADSCHTPVNVRWKQLLGASPRCLVSSVQQFGQGNNSSTQFPRPAIHLDRQETGEVQSLNNSWIEKILISPEKEGRGEINICSELHSIRITKQDRQPSLSIDKAVGCERR